MGFPTPLTEFSQGAAREYVRDLFGSTAARGRRSSTTTSWSAGLMRSLDLVASCGDCYHSSFGSRNSTIVMPGTNNC